MALKERCFLIVRERVSSLLSFAFSFLDVSQWDEIAANAEQQEAQ